MVKRTQTIHRQKPTNCLSVFDHFVSLALKVGFPLGQGSQGKSGNVLEGQGKSGKSDFFGRVREKPGRKIFIHAIL